MKIVSSTIYPLDIPFVSAFSHNLAERTCSNSVVVKIVTDSGICGFGEGVPRSYVTGESRENCIGHIRNILLPAVMNANIDSAHPQNILSFVDELLPQNNVVPGVVWNAARCAVELAVIDCLLCACDSSLAAVLPPVLSEVLYSGVISSGSLATVESLAERLKTEGFSHVKIKIAKPEDAARVRRVRDIMGPDVSIRLDANGAFNRDTALRFLFAVEKYDIDSIEQPLPRGDVKQLAMLRAASPIPVMVDESLVTLHDAEDLIAAQACDLFNLRLSKCGGLRNTLAIADRAISEGIGIQLGCQVGETAILSSAGRHVAAHLKELRFVEGSYGTHLLVEDIAEKEIIFGHRGIAPVITGNGLGISVLENVLEKHASNIISLG